MKKGTTIESGYDVEGRWCLKLRKAKGKFTLDEIISAAKEWEEDYYAVIIKAMSDETAQYYDDDLDGDYVTLYRATAFISKEVQPMKRLTINQNSEIKVKDIYGKMHDYKDVPNEFYGCIRKLYDYENTGYTIDFIDNIPHILKDMRECLLNPSVVNIRACLHMIDYILNTKEKDR